jgi:hypothetical protein
MGDDRKIRITSKMKPVGTPSFATGMNPNQFAMPPGLSVDNQISIFNSRLNSDSSSGRPLTIRTSRLAPQIGSRMQRSSDPRGVSTAVLSNNPNASHDAMPVHIRSQLARNAHPFTQIPDTHRYLEEHV